MLALTINAQNHPGNKPELLIGKEVVVMPEPFNITGFNDFYTANTAAYDKVYEPVDTYSSYSKIEALAGKKFKVVNVERVKDGSDTNIMLHLQGNGMPVLYYKYDPDFDMDFPFKVTGGLTLPKGFYCNSITKEGNDFSTDIEDGVSFFKTKVNGIPKYFMSVSQPGSKLHSNIKGATVTLSGNKKIQKDTATVKAEANDRGSFYYTSTFALTADDVTLLKTNAIISTAVYIYDSEVTSGDKLKGIFNCLITK